MLKKGGAFKQVKDFHGFKTEWQRFWNLVQRVQGTHLFSSKQTNLQYLQAHRSRSLEATNGNIYMTDSPKPLVAAPQGVNLNAMIDRTIWLTTTKSMYTRLLESRNTRETKKG